MNRTSKMLGLVVALALSTACESPDPPERTPEVQQQEREVKAPDPDSADRGAEVPIVEGAPRLEPVDEAGEDSSFEAYRAELIEAVRHRDEDALRAAIGEPIRYSFGGGDPTAEGFFAYWTEKERSDLWKELGSVLALGGAFDEQGAVRRFEAPYIFATWPDSLDAFTHVAATCDPTLVRAAPEENAEPFARLDHHVVELVLDAPFVRKGSEWRKIALPDGREGFVSSDCVRSSVDYRAGFEKIDGEWKMVFFVAGD